VGAMEDVDRMVEYRGYGYNKQGHVVDTATMREANLFVGPNELVVDRLPPVADLVLGMTWRALRKLEVRGTVHNALNARYYYPDAFYNLDPRIEFQPNPVEDFRAYLSATYQY